MSYDLHAFELPPGRDAREHYESGDAGVSEEPPTAAQRAWMDRLAAALMAVDPAAERVDDEDSVEIDTDSMQVMVFADQAAISVPYWFEGEEAEAVMRRAHEYARVLHEVGGLTVYDPQLEEVVGEETTSPGASVPAMEDTAAGLDELVADDREKVPRWKFWRRR
jgi:hypothetical protein